MIGKIAKPVFQKKPRSKNRQDVACQDQLQEIFAEAPDDHACICTEGFSDADLLFSLHR